MFAVRLEKSDRQTFWLLMRVSSSTILLRPLGRCGPDLAIPRPLPRGENKKSWTNGAPNKVPSPLLGYQLRRLAVGHPKWIRNIHPDPFHSLCTEYVSRREWVLSLALQTLGWHASLLTNLQPPSPIDHTLHYSSIVPCLTIYSQIQPQSLGFNLFLSVRRGFLPEVLWGWYLLGTRDSSRPESW